ncbi:MAG: hypothetical protein JO131_07500 [Gammaproteobacteria bacterium]|nr:hypothetical protein [Gammaproteobacteria bacterium]
MKNDNIVDFPEHQAKPNSPPQEVIISEDLCVAIEILIQRLRDNKPITQKTPV